MELSQHAKMRRQQRGISAEAIAAAMDWGMSVRQPGGRVAYFLGKRTVERLEIRENLFLERFKNTLVVVSHDGTIVTVGRFSRPNFHRKGRPRTSSRRWTR